MKAKLPDRAILPVTLGTAGHIDHGKTTLLRALAGGEAKTDRLAEERARGLTIDVGYAELPVDDGVEIGVVDVPGHEKFVRNMVAGATGIDVVLLVVAADDGVMPQTREHLQIMSLLGMTSGVIAITKADLVDDEMVELVASEVEDLVQGTFLEGASTFPVSGATGAGVDELRVELSRLARSVPPRDAQGFFRMPVLRVFTSPGFGTVLTGIPVSGRIELGERVEVQPGDRAGRVRGLQVYHRPAAAATAGHRTAINLAELGHKRVQRGDVVCERGVFQGAELLDVKLTVLPGLVRPLRHNQEVRLHVGTLDCAARVLLVGTKTLQPGATGWAQLKLDRPAVTAPGDRFILRLSAQLITLGGGVVLGPGEHASRRRSARGERLFEMREAGLTDLRAAVSYELGRAGLDGLQLPELERVLARRKAELAPIVAELCETGEVVDLGRGRLSREQLVSRAADRVVEAVRKHHDQRPLARGLSKLELHRVTRASQRASDGLLEFLATDGRVELLPSGLVRLPGWEPRLTADQQTRADRILEILSEDPWQAPRSGQLPQLVDGLPAEIDQILTLLAAQDRVVLLADGIVLPMTAVEEVKRCVAERCAESGKVAPSDLKAGLGISRKYGIPLLEYLDSVGFTRRVGDRRVLR